MTAKVDIDRQALAAFCQKHGIKRLSLFGSALRDDFNPDSDVDVLVEFEPDAVPGLEFFLMQDELGELLGRRVDLNTEGFLSPEFRERIVAEAELQYEQA